MAVAVVVGLAGAAEAGRKRVVVLELEGPKAARFHDELVKLIKKTHTIVTTEAWNAAAAQLRAASASERDLRKVARQLKVDAIVRGSIERRRDQFILRLKLHDGATGAEVGNGINTQAEGPRIEGQAQRDLKDELVDVIDSLEPGAAGAGDGADDEVAEVRPVKKPKAEAKPAKPVKEPRPADETDEPIAASNKPKADDDAATQQALARRDDKPAARAADGDARPTKQAAAEPRKPAEDPVERKAAAKQVAEPEPPADRAPADEPRAQVQPSNVLSPGERALDVVVGVSVTQRDLTFETRAGLANKPSGYSGSPVAGAMLDATLFPGAIGHHRTGLLKDLGITVLVDRVLKIDSRNAAGMVFPTTEYRYAAGVKYRHAFGHSATAPVVTAAVTYNIQGFEITNSVMANIPSITYHSVEPAVGLRWPFTERLSVGVDVGVPLVTDTGEISQPTQYGTAKILGIEGSLAVDYLITRSLFARVAFRYETIVHTFDGNGTQTTNLDGDPTTADVTSARDSYVGGFATVGALF